MTNAIMNKKALMSVAAVSALLSLSACTGFGARDAVTLPPSDAHAELVDARGADRGSVDIYRDVDGLRLELVARGFEPGSYGMHVHAVGQCTPPDFTSAGPHWNPTGAEHGRENPQGAHHGDLPNLVVEENRIGRATVRLVGTRFEGEGALLDADGAAFVIHAGPDDMRSDPSGNSGARIACGVIRQIPQ